MRTRSIDMLGTPFATTLTKSATQRCKPRAKLPQPYPHRLPSPHLPSCSLARILRPRHQRKLRASLPLSTTFAGTLLATKSHNSICTEQESRQRYTSTCPLLVEKKKQRATSYMNHPLQFEHAFLGHFAAFLKSSNISRKNNRSSIVKSTLTTR